MSEPLAFAGTELSDGQRRLLEEFRRGHRPALARAISMVENGRPGFQALLHLLHPWLGRAQRVGITGPPGAGKSTLSAGMIASFREAGERVGVVAVDPTSPFTGGALLGDRIRMNEVSLDDGVFIRSMATRGSLGGLAVTTREVADVLDAFGFERVLIETVGVGQAELDIAAAADTTIVLLVPESGDAIQTMKAGLMEIADVFVINKSDRPGAERLAREVEMTLHLRAGQTLRNVPAHHGLDLARVRARRDQPSPSPRPSPSPAGERSNEWAIPVLRTIAETGEGVPEVVAAVEKHRQWLVDSSELGRRRRARLAERVREVVERGLASAAWRECGGEQTLKEALPELEAGRATPYEVAARILRAVVG